MASSEPNTHGLTQTVGPQTPRLAISDEEYDGDLDMCIDVDVGTEVMPPPPKGKPPRPNLGTELANCPTTPNSEVGPRVNAEEFQEQLHRYLDRKHGSSPAQHSTPLELAPPRTPTLTITTPKTADLSGCRAFVETGTRMEYYSNGKKRWLPAIVHVLKISRQDQPLLIYSANVHSRRMNNVPLYRLRKPFESGDLVEVYTKEGHRDGNDWRWVPGEIVPHRLEVSTVAGYCVHLTESSLQAPAVVPADRIRLRFLEGQSVLVYKNVEEGWVEAVVCGPAFEREAQIGSVPVDPSASANVVANSGTEDAVQRTRSWKMHVIQSLGKAGFTDQAIAEVSNIDFPAHRDWNTGEKKRQRSAGAMKAREKVKSDGGDYVVEPWVLVPVRYQASGNMEVVPSFLLRLRKEFHF